MKIFGLGYDGFHDSCVSIIDEKGRIFLSINEERLSKVKKDGRFPKKSIKFASPTYNEILCISNLEDKEFKLAFKKAGKKINEDLLLERKKTFENINIFKNRFKKVYYFSHQDCHAASAYYFSGFNRAVVLTWDAGNNSEPWNMTVHIGKNSDLRRVEESLDGSPALDYAAITAIMGFIPARHEGKITGLSAFGKSSNKNKKILQETLLKTGKHDSLMGEIAKWKNVGETNKVPKIELNKQLIKELRSSIQLSQEDLASTIQKITEEKVLLKIKEIKKKYPEEKNICLAGGIFANVIINKKIKESGFKNIFIHPAMGDDGLALGACAKYLGEKGMHPKKLKDVFFGSKFPKKIIKKILLNSNLNFIENKNIEKEIAKKVSDGKIVARFLDKMEYGPRALGNRSILCSATNPNINKILNEKLKRSEFMPFAPISLKEDSEKLYKNIKGAIYASNFMTIAFDCTKKMKKDSPAVVHIDGTARPQIVGNENPTLKKILLEYKNITGLSSMINTSFNMHESPIVCYPEDAITAFKQSKLDFLAIENYMVNQ